MRGTEDPDFKLALLQVFKISEPAEIRETCEAIRQMYQADLIDVIADTVDQDRQSEPYKAASKFIQMTMLDLIHLYVDIYYIFGPGFWSCNIFYEGVVIFEPPALKTRILGGV